MVPSRDRELVQIVTASLADASARALRSDGTSWLACRPGCTPCCHGVFRISALDAERLRAALASLDKQNPAAGDAIRVRALQFVRQLTPFFPGDAISGALDPEENGTWEPFAELEQADAACPVLDPVSGRCELYEGRPLTCRVFGPPVQNEFGIGVCELCYTGATEAELLHGEMHLAHGALEEELNSALPLLATVIAWALLQPPLVAPAAQPPWPAAQTPVS